MAGHIDHFTCENCGSIETEFTFNFKYSQENKEALCNVCINKKGMLRTELEDILFDVQQGARGCGCCEADDARYDAHREGVKKILALIEGQNAKYLTDYLGKERKCQ